MLTDRAVLRESRGRPNHIDAIESAGDDPIIGAAGRADRWPVWTLIASGLVLALLAASVTIGADSMWLVALGDTISRDGAIPAGIPFAAADSAHWANVPVLGELILAGLHRLGSLGLPAAQLAVDAALLGILAVGARRAGARDVAIATVLFLAAIGSLPALGVVRAQTLSLVPFAILILLLRAETRRPTRGVWLLVPLVAGWANLHGAVIVGVAVAGCYLVLQRLRSEPAVAAGVLAAICGALFVTPAGLRTFGYYHHVFTNEAARRHNGLWAALSVTNPFDVLLIGAAVILVGLSLLRRRSAWEYVVLAALAVATASAARNGIWLVLFAVAPAACALTDLIRRPAAAPNVSSAHRAFALVLAATMAVTTAFVLGSRESSFRSDGHDAAAIRQIAAGRIVLAPEPLVETLAASGVKVWLSDPIDAFSRADQAAYLDFVDGTASRGAARALSAAQVVVVKPSTPSAALATGAGFTPTDRVGGYEVMQRR